MTYLPDAVHHGAELFTHAKVLHVAKSGGERWSVEIVNLDPSAPAESRTMRISAGMVVLAAGTLGSTEILLRSRDKGLTVSDRLGYRFSANGDIIAFGYGADVQVNAIGVGHPIKEGLEAVGASVSGQLEIDDPDDLAREVRVQEGVLPSALAPILPVMFVPNGRLLGALKSLISGVYQGPLASLQTFFAVSHDSAAGRLVLDGDAIKVAWPDAAQESVYQHLDGVLGKLVENVGGSYVKNPLAGSVMGHQPATAHPLGGCAMAVDSAAGVVDHKGRVFDSVGGYRARNTTHDGLYVIDGSVIPRSLGVNPLLTITALAERALIHMAGDFNLAVDSEPRQWSQTAAPETPAAGEFSSP